MLSKAKQIKPLPYFAIKLIFLALESVVEIIKKHCEILENNLKTYNLFIMNNIIDEFNNTIDEFIQKLINQFPEESKLKKYHKTFKLTNLSKLKKGSFVNIEIDILSKYVKNFFNEKK